MKSANSYQIGGSHYRSTGGQHWDLVGRYNLDYFRGCATKYLLRHKKKGGAEDLRKAAHYLHKAAEIAENRSQSLFAALFGLFLPLGFRTTYLPNSRKIGANDAIALELCKQHYLTEEETVLFHRTINAHTVAELVAVARDLEDQADQIDVKEEYGEPIP